MHGQGSDRAFQPTRPAKGRVWVLPSPAPGLQRHALWRHETMASAPNDIAGPLRASAQTIRGIHGDAELLTDEELVALVRAASVVIGATGSDALDRRLNLACRTAGVPLVVPGM